MCRAPSTTKTMNRNDPRNSSPRRLSTLVEVTEPASSIHEPDRRSVLTFLTNPYTRTDTPSAKSVVYVGESPNVIQITRRGMFKKYRKKFWFWPSILATATLVILLLVAIVLTFWDHTHKDKSTEMIHTTTTIRTTASKIQDSCTAEACTAIAEPTSAGASLNVVTALTTGLIGSVACADGSCNTVSISNAPPVTIDIVTRTSEVTLADLSGRYSTTTAITTIMTTTMDVEWITTTPTRAVQGQEALHGTSKAWYLTHNYTTTTVQQRPSAETPFVARGEAEYVWRGRRGRVAT